MALRAFYFIRALRTALTYYYINRSQRHLLVAIENNRFGGPIDHNMLFRVVSIIQMGSIVKGVRMDFTGTH